MTSRRAVRLASIWGSIFLAIAMFGFPISIGMWLAGAASAKHIFTFIAVAFVGGMLHGVSDG